jgi:anti-sigma-K factor RskA
MYDDAQDALAAEYVLGTLAGDEREHAEALLEIDPGFAESVRVWERRLGELNVMVEAVEPPAEVWDKIRAEVGDVAEASEIPWADAGAVAAPPPLPTAGAVPPPLPPPTASAAPEAITTEHAGMVTDTVPTVPADFHEGSGEAPSLGLTPRDAHDDDVADSIAASLAKSLAEPAAPPPPFPPADRGARDRSAEVIYLANRVSLWRTVAIATETIAALLAIYVAAAQFYPALIPLRVRTQQVAQAPAGPAALSARLVAVLQQEPTSPAFLLTVDPQSRTMIVRRVSATADAGRSYELWLISKQFPAPRSLGLVGKDEFTQRQIPGNYDVAALRAASYAVSLEPAGGSPSGVPTGPVLFTGKMVDSIPTATPATPQPRT